MVIGDFKRVPFLVGLQGGFTTIQCYLCLLDGRNIALHWKKRNWRASCEIGTYNVKRQYLVDAAKILMPPLNIKLGLIKQFVKQVNTQSLGHSSRFKSCIQNCQRLEEKRLINSSYFLEMLSD